MTRASLILIPAFFAFAGCGLMTPSAKAPSAPIVAPVESKEMLPPLGVGTSASVFDKSSQAEKAAALAKPDNLGARPLGKTVVGLGNPAEQGFWLRSTLVSTPGKGRVVTASGASVAVDLVPGSGGALLSLAAFRALGLNLTDLPEVSVFID